MNTFESMDRQQADSFVTQTVRGSGSSFYWGMRRLPADRRIVMYAVYAFCRIVDDIADGDEEPEVKLRRLGDWKTEIDRLYQGAPRHPVTTVLHEGGRGLGFRKEDFLAVIEGMEMDAAARVRMRDDAELLLYCDRVACAVGRLSNRVFGAAEDYADFAAKALGEALQLTNILRDIDEDAARDRLYLPTDRLRHMGVTTDDVGGVLAARTTGQVCADLGALAERRFEEARAILLGDNRVVMRPAIMMMMIYERILAKLRARGWEHFRQRVSLSKTEKLWIAFRHGIL